MSKRKSEFKPLLFTTTLRNPERIKEFLQIISDYEGKKLTNDLIMDICGEIIKSKIYSTNYIKSKPILKEIYEMEDAYYSQIQIAEIINNSPQNHKEAGFDKGWPSRFDTWYKFIKELGFVYYQLGETIEISDAGRMLLSAGLELNEKTEMSIFLNAFVKYQRNNPFRRVLNENKPLVLLLMTILELKEITGNKNEGVHLFEAPYFICWKDSSYKDLARFIVKNRTVFGLKPSREIIYENCKEILDLHDKDETRYKISNLLNEMPDDFIRKMRLTGLISIRGLGNYIDLNQQLINKVPYIIDKYQEIIAFESERDYYNHVSKLDLVLIDNSTIIQTPELYKEKALRELVENFEIEVLRKELSLLSKRNGKSTHYLFKYIEAPTRLEFLVSLLLKKTYPNLTVHPNYPIDDEGLPTSTAGGGLPDIYCRFRESSILVEVTMLNSSQQNIRETPPVIIHLKDELKRNSKSSTFFIAPLVHEQTSLFLFLASKENPNIKIRTFSIEDFIKDTMKYDDFGQYLNC